MLECFEARFEVYEVEFEAKGSWEGFQQPAAGWDDFLSDAITWDETYVPISSPKLLHSYAKPIRIFLTNSESTGGHFEAVCVRDGRSESSRDLLCFGSWSE